MITASKSNGEDKVELPGWGPEDWVKPVSCLAEVFGLEEHVCGGLDCVKTLEKQHKQLTVLFGNVVMKARTETELIAGCHGGTDALGFYSMFGSLESLLNLEQKHEVVTAISVEVFPGVLQTEQKYIRKWREAIETEMNIRHSETYCRPSGARYLVGSTLAPNIDLDLFETMCKVLNIPMEVKKIWARKRLMPWFRADMSAWLYEYAKKHMSKHGRVYSEYQLDIGAGAFKRALVTHRNAVTSAVKRISRTSERSGKEKAEMLKEDLERNVTLCLHNSFCRNRESNVDPLPCCKQRVEEQKCCRTASSSVRIANDVLQDTETESAESVSQEEEMEH